MHVLAVAIALVHFSSESGKLDIVTIEDAKIAITISSYLGADTALLRIEKVSSSGSLRQIMISSTAEGEKDYIESKLSITRGGISVEVVCKRPRKPSHASYSTYDLAIRDCMFAQAATEALKKKDYKGLSLHWFNFAGHKVSVQDEYNERFGASPMAEFDDQYRLIKFGDGGR